MSENTRLDIDSNIPQEMDKIGKAVDFAARRLEALAKNPVSALEELRNTLSSIHTGASSGAKGADDLFNKMVATIRSSPAPAEMQKMYESIEKAAAKHHKRMLELQEDANHYENQILESQAAYDKARLQKKGASQYKADRDRAALSLAMIRSRIAEEDSLNDSQVSKAKKIYEKLSNLNRAVSPLGPLLGTGENGVSSVDPILKSIEGRYNELGLFISKKAEDLRVASQKAQARALMLDTGEVRKYTAQAQKEVQGHYDALGNFVPSSAAVVTQKLAEQAKAQARALMLDTGEVRKYTAQAQKEVQGHYDTLGNFVPRSAAKPVSLVANPGKTTSELTGLSAGFRKLGDDMGYAHSFARGLASGFNLLWLTWGKLAPLFAGASISYGVAKTFEFGSEIEYNIRFLETLGDMTRTQGKVIREELRKMDESTMFSMTELSKTMITLGQSGYAAKDSLLMTKTSADLATVGMTDMATSTDLLMQVMKLFGKTSADAEKVSSQLFEATKVSAMNLSDLGSSFKYASIAGIAYNQTLEGTLAGYAALSEGGIKKSMAGTSFINLLQDLSGRSKKSIDAMETLRKKTGETIKIFDDTGKMRNFADIVFEIDKAVKMFDPTKQMKLVNDIFTERGIREYFALIGVGKERVDELVKSLEKVDPKKAFNAALNMQDTVKAGLEIMKSTLTSSLDRVFEANSGKFREFFTGMTNLIGSKEFINSVNLMVNAFSGLYETLKVVGPALLVVGGGFLAMKSVAMVQTGVASLTTALGTLIPVLAQSRGSFLTLASSSIASATAVQGQGLALLQTGVMARGAAGGIEAAAVASALTATSATKAVPAIRALAIVMGFLTNPIVGVITTLGILGATWWATSRDSMTASEQLSNKVVENGKVNVKALDEEIKKLLERNSITAQKSPIADMLPKAEADAKAAYATVKRLQDTYDAMEEGPAKANLARQLVAERQKAKNSVETWQELTKGNKRYHDGIAAQERVAEVERERKLREAQEKAGKPTGTIDPTDPAVASGKSRALDRYASSYTRLMAAIRAQTTETKQLSDAEIARIDAGSKHQLEILDARHKAGLVSEGAYQAGLIQVTSEAEASKVSELERTQAKVHDLNVQEITQQGLTAALALKEFKGSQADREILAESHAEKLVALSQQIASDDAKFEAEKYKVRQEGLTRLEKAEVEHQGKLIKSSLEASKYLADLSGERAKESALVAVNRQYENVNDSSVIWLQAEKAAATASAEAVGKHEAQLRGMTLEYEKVAEAASALAEADRKLAAKGYVLPELSTAAGQMEEQRKVLEMSIGEFRKQINQDVADQAAIAYNESFRKRSSEFKNTVAQSLADAMFAGAENGSKSLRKILEAELKAPFVLLFRMSIDALMGDLGKAAGSTGGTGSSGLSGALSGLSAASTLSTAYKALSGAIEGSIGKSFEKFATSSFGETLGLSQSSNAGYALPSDLAGTMSEATDAFTSATSEMTSLGKTFTDVGTGMAAAFAGQALRKGISGGYRTGNALESTMDVASIAAGFVPVIGPVLQLVTGAVSGLINRAFGRKVKDTGIQGSFGSQGFSGENYTFEKGGWFRSNKTRTSSLDQSTTNTFTNTFKSIQASTAVLATNMGLSAQAAVDFRKDIKLSLNGLSAEEQSTALTKMFTDMQEEMATSVLNAWGDWSVIAKYGETASQVLTNVSNNLTGFNGMLDMLDLRLITLSVTGAAAASSIIEAAGGVDALTGMYSSYYENFYSEVERNGKSIETLREKFSALGITMPALAVDAEGFVTNGDKARETFRGLVTAAADAGNITLATELVKLSSTFAEVTPLAEKFLKGLKDETKSLNAELLKAQGNLAGYSAALRAIETVGMTEVEAATYDYNQTLAKHIELLGQADEARATATAAEISLLQAQGNETAALAKQRELDIKGMSEAQVAAYDYSAAIDKQVTAMEKLSEARDSVTASDVKLLQAQGREVEALAKQRELDIRSMTLAEVVAYDYNQAIDEQVSKLENAADIVSKFGDVSGNLRDYLAGFAEDSSTLFETTVRESLSGSFEAMGRVAQDADKAIEKAKASSRSTAEFSLKQANILAQVGNVKAYADTMSKETDTDKLIEAIKGETTTSKEVTGLGTRLSSQDLAVSLNATLSAVKKTASANLDIVAISSMFDSMLASVTEMSLTEQASAEGQSLLGMFNDMSASVLYISMDAPISEVAKVTKVFSSLTAFVKKVSAEGLPAGSAQVALGAAAEVAAAIKTISATGLKSGSAQLALSSLANITSYITEIDVKKGNTLSAQFASELAAYSSISANISKIVTAPNIVEERKKSLVTTLSTIAATINAVNVNAAIPEARKVALNAVFSNLSSSITSVNVNAAIPEARKVALNAVFSNLSSSITSVNVNEAIPEARKVALNAVFSNLSSSITSVNVNEAIPEARKAALNAVFSNLSSSITSVNVNAAIPEARKAALNTVFSNLSSSITSVNVNSAIPEITKAKLNSIFSDLQGRISEINIHSSIPEVRKAALNAIFSNLLSNISTVSVSYGIVEDRRAQMLQSLGYLGAVIGYITTAPNLVPETVDSITDSLDSFQAVITKVAISSQDSNLKSLLLGNISEVSYGLSISSAIAAGMGSFGLSASQTKELLSSSEIVKAIAVSAGTDGTLTAAQQEAYANARTEITKALKVSSGIDSALTDAQKTVLFGAETALQKALSVKPGTDGVLTDAQKTVLFGAETALQKALSVASGTDGALTAAQQSVLSGTYTEVSKAISVRSGTDGTLTAAQQEAYANASDSITKAVSVVRGTDATNLTDAQKTLLGILGGTSDGQVTVGGSVDYAPSNELDTLFEGLTTALGKVGIQEMTAALGQLVSAIDQQLAADALAKAAANKQRAIADAQVAGAKVKARQNSAIQGVNTAISEVWQHASNAGVWLNKDSGAALTANTYEIKVNDSGLLEYTSWGQTTYGNNPGQADAFNAAYRAGDLSNRTYGQASNLQNLASELEAARQQVRNLGGVPEFATGGYTGPGKVNDVAGIVHKGEVVWSQSDIANAGGLDTVEAMRAGFMPYTQDIPAPAITYSGAQSTIGFDDSALLQELQALREEVSSMRYEVRATAVNTGKSAKNLKEFYDRGIKVKNSETGPLETTVV